MKKIYNFVPFFLISFLMSGVVAAATGAVASAIPVPLTTDMFSVTGKETSIDVKVAQQDSGTVANYMKQDPVLSSSGLVETGATSDSLTVRSIQNVEEMVVFMQAFKEKEIEEIQKTLAGLERMLYGVEKELAGLAPGADPKSLLVKWAKIKSAIEGERQVLAAVKGMPEQMAYPQEELGYGYEQAKKTIELLSDASKKITKESVGQSLKSYQEYAFKQVKDDGKDKKKKAITFGRDELALYYELAIGLYDDFLRMTDALWLTSAHAFVKQKTAEINNLQEQLKPELGIEGSLVPLQGAGGLISEKMKKRLEKELVDVKCKEKRMAECKGKIEKYRDQQKAIWQNDGAVVGKRELVEQRRADWNEAKAAENDARTAKGTGTDEWIKFAIEVTNEAWNALVKDQGRYDLEQVIVQARETLRTIVTSIRAIDENDLETESTKRGMRILMHEAGLFNQTKYVNGSLGNSFFNHLAAGLSKHIALFKEMKPISADFEMRLRAVSRMYPALAVALPTVRVLADKYAPGIVDVWA